MTIDVVDATESSDEEEVKTIRSAGLHPIVMAGMSGAVEQVVQNIIRRTSGLGKIELLRFHGHGAPGMMNIAAGKTAAFQHHSGVSKDNLHEVARQLARLKPYFAPMGRVELHGCDVAHGPAGETLLLRLAAIWDVPVTAGVESQYGVGEAQFRFEGPTVTARPDGSLSSGLP